MEDEIKQETKFDASSHAQDRVEKVHFQRQLRGLELKAYSGVLEALRASGKPNSEKDGIIKTLREFFNITEDRHKAELRVLAYDDKLSLISQKLSGHDFTEDWAYQAQRIYVPLGPEAFSLYRNYPPSLTRSCATLRDPIPSVGKNKITKYDEDSDVHSEAELELIDNIIKDHPVCNGWQSDKPKSLSIAVEPGTGNEDEIEKIEHHLKKRIKSRRVSSVPSAKSPDITEAPRTPTRPSAVKSETKSSNTAKGRGVKRKDPEEQPPTPSENVSVSPTLRPTDKLKNRRKIKKPNRPQAKIKIPRRLPPPPPTSDTKKAKESSEETSSADEGENGPLPLEESSRVMSPVFSEVIRSSVLSRGKGSRARGGLDGRRNNVLSSPTKTKTGKARPRTPNQKSGKFKNSITTSGSRRKSKLNEKIDYDDVLMDLDGNEMDKQHAYASNNDEVSRRHMLDSQSFDSRVVMKDYKSSEDVSIYSESLPVNYNHEDMEQVTDGVFKRPLPPSRGPKPWEIKDARLSVREEVISDENNGNNIQYGEIDSSQQQNMTTEMMASQINNVNDISNSSSPTKHNELPPPPKKQRIKSPLIVNPNINPPNVSKVPLPAPVFSTSLSKKRQNNKPISVVDSLNLHLPTSATASSLAASSNNRRVGSTAGGGCSMFSNSSALIAGARGTAPGILQQQRKAQPHILANSKVHQRAFLPAATANSSISNTVSSSIVPTISSIPPTIPSISPAVSSGVSTAAVHSVPVSSSPIPISAMSPLSPSSTPISFQNFPSSNTPNLNISSAGIPIGHVNRSATGANIIFVQKTNGPAVAGSGTVSGNMIPLKTPPRAVILRRTQLPRPGNLMILDMQKNQIVGAGQPSPFLQTARILNAPGELSLLNVQTSSSPPKSTPTIISTSSVIPSSTSSVQTLLSPTQILNSDGTIVQVTGQESFVTNFSDASNMNQELHPVVTSVSSMHADHVVVATDQEINEPDATGVGTDQTEEDQPQDAEYAQIEAELMQMEQGSFEEVVYEEEVTTEIVPLEDGDNTQYIYTNEADCNIEGETMILSQEAPQHNNSTISGSSTDTASENDTSINNLELISENDTVSEQTIIKTVSLSPVDDMKIASDAITRALSLSKSATSPVKKLTFSAPITLGTSTFSLTSGAKSNIVSDAITVSANSTQFTVVPAVYQTSSSELLSPAEVSEEDPSSTNNIHIENSAASVGMVVHNNDLLQQSHQLQENANVS